MKDLQQNIEQLNFGEMLMIPGGWNGATTRGTVIHMIEKTKGNGDETSYSFLTCNAGEGLEYTVETRDLKSGKLKYKTCLRVNGIPYSGFWTMR